MFYFKSGGGFIIVLFFCFVFVVIVQTTLIRAKILGIKSLMTSVGGLLLRTQSRSELISGCLLRLVIFYLDKNEILWAV